MKKICYLIGAGTMLLLAAACSKDDVSETTEKETGRTVSLTASIDDENNSEAKTRATLNESSGAFAFSQHDEIKVFNGTNTYEGRTTAAGNNDVEIEMATGFTLTGSGFAGFPASMVSSITASGVTFVLPTSYTYAQVGSEITTNITDDTSTPSASKVPCPMMATYNSASASLVFRQVGAVVRFRVTNCVAGSLTFTFPTAVTGTATVAATPTTAGAGGITSLTSAGNSITVTGVPAVDENEYIYITLPVINGTKPQNILVTNIPGDGNSHLRTASLTGTSSSLTRAGGYKVAAALTEKQDPIFKINATQYVVLAFGNLMAKIDDTYNGGTTATVAEWKFGGPLDYVGDGTSDGNYLFAHSNTSARGKWIDLFEWQGESAETKVQGVTNVTSYNGAIHGTVIGESLYSTCWRTSGNNQSPAAEGYIHVTNGGSYNWRPLTSAEWDYIMGTNEGDKRTGATIGGSTGWYCSRATIAGIKGLLIFPDDLNWANNLSSLTPPTDKNPGSNSSNNFTATYTPTQYALMEGEGIVFLPSAGWRDASSKILNAGKWGYYWTSSSSSSKVEEAIRISFNDSQVLHSDGTFPRIGGRSVRLARRVNVSGGVVTPVVE